MMHETGYAYAVARVRVNELTLLSAADIEQLISAQDYKQVMQQLSEHGWGDVENIQDYSKYLEKYREKSWKLLEEVLDDIHELDMFIIRNDMQNLKAALKCIISQQDPRDLLVSPSVYDSDEIVNAVEERNLDSLPELMRDAAYEAYSVLTRTGNGQLADAIIDTKTLELIKKLGDESKSEMLSNCAECMCVTADIKVALRCANTGKSKEFVESSICKCDTLDKSSLVTATLEGKEELLSYISNTRYGKAVDMIEISTSAFEKWCDDLIMECVKPAKYKHFGIEPMAAYYLAKDAEIKTVRIIISAKLNDLPADIIRERVRALYV